MDARKSDDSNRGAIKSLQSRGGGWGAGGSPPHDVRRSDDSSRGVAGGLGEGKPAHDVQRSDGSKREELFMLMMREAKSKN